MPYKILTTDKPTDIYAIGSWAEGIDDLVPAIGLTDDYSTIDTFVEDEEVHVSSDNVGSIRFLTKEQLLEYKELLEADDCYPDHGGLEDDGYPRVGRWSTTYCILIENLHGDLKCDVVNEDTGESYLNNYDPNKEFDIWYAYDRSDETEKANLSARLIVPKGASYKPLHVYEAFMHAEGLLQLPVDDVTTIEEVESLMRLVSNSAWNYISDADYHIRLAIFLGFMLNSEYREQAEALIVEHNTLVAEKEAQAQKKELGYFRGVMLVDVANAINDDDKTYKLLAQFYTSCSDYLAAFNKHTLKRRRYIEYKHNDL